MVIRPLGEEDLQNRLEKKKHLESWMSGYKQYEAAAPFVANLLETTEWEIDALENKPDSVDEILSGEVSDSLKVDLETTKKSFPLPPKLVVRAVDNTAGTSSTGTAGIYEVLARAWDLEDDETKQFSAIYRSKYEEIQERQNRPEELRKLLEKFGKTNILERFDRAKESVSQYKLHSQTKTSAASDVRTFLEGLNGNLRDKAKKWSGENDPHWSEIALRLCRDQQNLQSLNEIEHWGKKYDEYHARLSKMTHDREHGIETNLLALWTEMLDRVYALLNMIEL